MSINVKKRFSLKPGQIILLGFLVLILFGAFVLCLPISSKDRGWLNFTDALFTSFSSVCVTGLTVVQTQSHFSGFGQAVILVLVQIGGLGFMTATTLIMLVMGKKISFKSRLTISDSLNLDTAKGVVKLVRSIVIFSLAAEFIGAMILLPFFVRDSGGIGVWQAVFTSVSAFCNAGFDLFNPEFSKSLSAYRSNAAVCLTVAFLVMLGGIGFTVINDVYKNKFKTRKLSLHSKVVLLITPILLVFGTVFFLIAEYNNVELQGENFGVKLLTSFFHSVSLRTAGFSTINQGSLSVSSKVVSAVLMFIGASPGSTGGGIKTTTFMLLVFTVINSVRGRDKVSGMKHTYPTNTVLKAVSVMMLSLTIVLFFAIFLAAAEQNNAALNNAGLFHFENVLFEAISTYTTTGLTTGIVPYLSVLSKYVTMAVMFFGRLGLINIAFAFFNDNSASIINYPEGNIMIG